MTEVAAVLPPGELELKSSTEESSVMELIPEDSSATDIFSGKGKQKNSENDSTTQRNSEPIDSENHGSQKKNRNRRRRKWKPYCKLTYIERKELEEREARRANRIREEMTASGLALAPYNTTQFLMEDHNVQEPDYEQICNGHRHRDYSNSSSDDFYSSPEDEEEFLQQQFVQTYEDIHAERLNNMTKSELVEELVSVEDKVEALEKILAEARAQSKSGTVRLSSHSNLEAELEKIRVFREEIEKLKKVNDALERENHRLRLKLKKNQACSN